MPRFLLLALLCLSAGLAAADNGAKRFTKLKDDGSLYVGEGTAESKAFGGDGLKALAAARERARASLAAAIRVRIVSETSSTEKSGPGGSSESVESKSASLADVVLENVRYEDFPGLPAEGHVSSLAIVSKEDYRRQLAGKGPRVYRPEWGIRAGVVANTFFDLVLFAKDEGDKSRSGIPTAPGSGPLSGGAPMDSLLGFGLEFRFRDWSLGLDQALGEEVAFFPYDPATGLYRQDKRKVEVLGLEAGYDWTPWAWRIQPFLPLRMRAHFVSVGDYGAWATAASAGFGLRFWPNDSLAFEASGRYLQSISKAQLQAGGKPLYLAPGKQAELGLGGAQWQFSLMWSGF